MKLTPNCSPPDVITRAARHLLVRWRYGCPLRIFASLGLVAWILGQVLWLQVFHPVMRPLVRSIGIAIAVLGWLLPSEEGSRRQGRPAGRVPA
ncbi:hypothetical protein J7I84_07495 [Arthrobacter sp. ISL-85]|uniref:hypothetical protein n=1 Tax=Arthrobacter sp. ISL-85 TaxID=2819115 RepID=UPI001BE691F0|nr:hypothetical protein [Arthrobacter sp. ISL-85]MBT2566336.1 hypothetical protein [Arthrobacter sp. ISL-85]